MNYTQLHKVNTNLWIKKILKEEKEADSRLSDELIDKTHKNDPVEFAQYIEAVIAKNSESEEEYESAGEGLPRIDERLDFTEGHMQKMPVLDLLFFYFQLKELPIDVASSPYFWGALTLDLMKKKRIQPRWLVYGGSSLDKTDTDKQRRLLVRRIIRSLCSPGFFRGMPELFTDCSLARAYWCGRLALEIAEKSGCNIDRIEKAVLSGCDKETLGKELGPEADQIKKIVYILNEIWSTLAIYLTGGLTVLRESNVIAGMVQWFLANEERADLRSTDRVKEVAHLTGQLTSYVMLDFHPYPEAKEIIGLHLDKNLL